MPTTHHKLSNIMLSISVAITEMVGPYRLIVILLLISTQTHKSLYELEQLQCQTQGALKLPPENKHVYKTRKMRATRTRVYLLRIHAEKKEGTRLPFWLCR